MNFAVRLRELADYTIRSIAGTRDPLIPPPWLHSVGDSSFRETGVEFMGHFNKLCGLKPTERILDVGSGSGRMAIHLAGYLTTGTYDGVEIIRRSVEWCQRAYSNFPNFRFQHADVFNGRYNPRGTPAHEYRFPFEAQSFDFVFLTSVFTHMLSRDVEHYLSEIRRVMAPGGRALITAFLVNDATRVLIDEGQPDYSFRHEMPGCFVETPRQPERATAYSETKFREMVNKAGLEIRSVHPGNWAGRPGISTQD